MSWADKRIEYDRKIREKRKADGLCYQCGQPLPGGGWNIGRCPACVEKINAYQAARYQKRKAARAYEERCEKNRRAAEQRWETAENGSPAVDANAYERIQTDANDTKQTNNQSSNQSNNIPSGGDTHARTRGSGKQSGKRLTVGGPDAAGRVSGAKSPNTQATHRDEPVPPTVDDINAYCREAGLVHVDPIRFYDNYAVSGWMRNGEPIRDWKALCRKWDAEDAEKAAHAAPKPQETSFDTDEFFEAALARSYADYNGEGGWTDES